MGHLVRKNAKTGEITTWPWIELSMTPTPANLYATLDFATAKSHFKSAGLVLPIAARNAKHFEVKGASWEVVRNEVQTLLMDKMPMKDKKKDDGKKKGKKY